MTGDNTTVLGFAFNTMQERVNLPTIDGKHNRSYLPDLLVSIDDPQRPGRKLLPLTGESWDVGVITGPQGRTISEPIATWYGNYLTNVDGLDPSTTVAIADPAHPDPSLRLDDVAVIGLHNLFLLPGPTIHSSADGYQLTFSLAANRFETLPKVHLEGEFVLRQAVCLRDPASPDGADRCGGYSTEIEGTGSFAVAFNDLLVDVDVFLSTTAEDPLRSLHLEIRSLEFRGESGEVPDFSVVIQSITKAPKGLEQIWIQLAESAFSSPEAKARMLENLQATLNSARNRDGIGRVALRQVQSFLDKVFGAVRAEGLPGDRQQRVPNPVDLYVLDRLRVALDDPSSDWYLPVILRKNASPELEPYSADTIDLGRQTIAGLPWDANALSQVVMTGLSNNRAPPEQVVGADGDLKVTATQGQLSSPPPGVPRGPLTLKGGFSLRPQGMECIVGTFQTVIDASQFHIVGRASGDRVETLVISLSRLSLELDPDKMVTELVLPAGSGLGSIASRLVNSPKVKQSIREALNEKLSSRDLLDSVGANVTKLARAVLLSRLVAGE